MNELLDRCRDGFFNSAGTEFCQRKSLRLIAGPFGDKIATVNTLVAEGRVRVLPDILSRPTPRIVRSFELVAPNFWVDRVRWRSRLPQR